MRARDLALNVARLGFAMLGVVAVTYQYASIDDRLGFSAGNFFSFFTIQRYPYPFVDVARHGYDRVALNGVLLLVAFAVAAVAFVIVGNWRARMAASRA